MEDRSNLRHRRPDSSTDSAGAEKTAPTYYKDVVRILQKNCQDCHRPNQVAPFALLTYEQARNGRPILYT